MKYSCCFLSNATYFSGGILNEQFPTFEPYKLITIVGCLSCCWNLTYISSYTMSLGKSNRLFLVGFQVPATPQPEPTPNKLGTDRESGKSTLNMGEPEPSLKLGTAMGTGLSISQDVLKRRTWPCWPPRLRWRPRHAKSGSFLLLLLYNTWSWFKI